MEIVELAASDEASVVSLWAQAGLTRLWNEPSADFQRAVMGCASAVLGLKENGELIGAVMVGNDGHRGWVYYLAVSGARQHRGNGGRLMAAAEDWLRDRGAVKVQLMVRDDNASVLSFYEAAGYERSGVRVLSRWLAGA